MTSEAKKIQDSKPISKNLKTFLSWGKESVIGYTEENGLVVKIWCKICARNKTEILTDALVKGVSNHSLKAFTEGTCVVTKYQVDRHLRGQSHRLAVLIDNGNSEDPGSSCIANLDMENLLTITQDNREALLKMIRTAYEMALKPSMPHCHFKTLIKCQRLNGALLLQGKDNNKAAREYISCIASAIKEKVAKIVNETNFFSILSDGSQARKTKDEKELILVRVEREGTPACFVVSLLDMNSLGGMNANTIKKAIDSIFIETGSVPLTASAYKYKLVSATADGACVNFGIYNGVLTQLKKDRMWLIKIHCVNHRLELAIKDAVKDISQYKECERFYISIFNLFRNSGKLKCAVKKAAEALNITFYTLPKIFGTRFISHRRRGFTKLLHNWPSLIVGFDNTLADRDTKADMRAKLSGLSKRLHDYRLLCMVCSYLDILEKLSPLSLVFEKQMLMVNELKPAVDITKASLAELSHEDIDNIIDSYLLKFKINEKDGSTNLLSSYFKEGNELKKSNPEFVEIELNNMANLNFECIHSAIKVRKLAIEIILPLINDRFSSLLNPIFESMDWLDPQVWIADSMYGDASISLLLNEFFYPLEKLGMDFKMVLSEWRAAKLLINAQYTTALTPLQIWQNIFLYYKIKFPNLSLLVELLMCIAGSNSAVERVFSILTVILTDRRLKMNHSTMEDSIIIAGNDTNFTQQERDDILSRAVDIFLDKRRVFFLDSANASIATDYSSEESCTSEDISSISESDG
ncbi:zinc finger protein 862-like [Hydra vulgaris]|uniref:Zinc finger protein 862-like n=1 Tax=Hydra vulgaris TaxID=6087 RepID=A0ABM4CT52_HYDVU